MGLINLGVMVLGSRPAINLLRLSQVHKSIASLPTGAGTTRPILYRLMGSKLIPLRNAVLLIYCILKFHLDPITNVIVKLSDKRK